MTQALQVTFTKPFQLIFPEYSGITPVWTQEFRFHVVYKELATILFMLRDASGNTLAYYSCVVSHIR